jgi:hypothetical protein
MFSTLDCSFAWRNLRSDQVHVAVGELSGVLRQLADGVDQREDAGCVGRQGGPRIALAERCHGGIECAERAGDGQVRDGAFATTQSGGSPLKRYFRSSVSHSQARRIAAVSPS